MTDLSHPPCSSYRARLLRKGATGFLQHILVNEKELVLKIYDRAGKSCFWLPVAACCVGFVAALGLNWNSVMEKEKERDEEKKGSGSESKPISGART